MKDNKLKRFWPRFLEFYIVFFGVLETVGVFIAFIRAFTTEASLLGLLKEDLVENIIVTFFVAFVLTILGKSLEDLK